MKRSGPVGGRRQPGDRDGRGVGGQHRFRIELRAELRVDLALDALVLGGGLDDEVAAAEIGHGGRRRNAAHRFLASLLGQLAAGNLTGHVAADRGDAGLDAVLGDVVEQRPCSRPAPRHARCRCPSGPRRRCRPFRCRS